MSGEKRKRIRAIIFKDKKIVSMYREFDGRHFYTFPGGGVEGDESEETCVVREVFEEFGLNIKPIKKVYIYENERSIEHFYLCQWLSGKFGSGQGEEFQPENKNGVYKPMLIEIDNIPNLPLMPKEVATAFYEDFMKNGEMVRETIKHV